VGCKFDEGEIIVIRGKEMFVIHSTIATTDWDKILAHSRYLTQTRHKICRPQICHNYFWPCLMRCGGVKLIGTLLHKMNQCITISKRTTCHQTGLEFLIPSRCGFPSNLNTVGYVCDCFKLIL
jgi:hypothetical protein